jgi:hypothetical protein
MVSAKALRFQFLWPDPESGFFYFRSSAFRLRFLAPALLMAKILSILISGSAQVRLACSTIFLRTSVRAKAFLMAAPLFMVRPRQQFARRRVLECVVVHKVQRRTICQAGRFRP